jgi:putative endonuclease
MQQSDKRHELGAAGEKVVAAKYLEWGYTIVARRYRTPYGEIDLIVKKDKTIVFLEVKSRSQGQSDDFISKSQIKRNGKAAQLFLYTYEFYQSYEIRFDLAVVIGEQIYDIIENAWTYDS